MHSMIFIGESTAFMQLSSSPESVKLKLFSCKVANTCSWYLDGARWDGSGGSPVFLALESYLTKSV